MAHTAQPFSVLTAQLFAKVGADLPSELVKRLIAYADTTGEDLTSVVEDAVKLHLDACAGFDPRALAATVDFPT